MKHRALDLEGSTPWDRYLCQAPIVPPVLLVSVRRKATAKLMGVDTGVELLTVQSVLEGRIATVLSIVLLSQRDLHVGIDTSA